MTEVQNRNERPSALPVQPAGIPAELKALPRWVGWAHDWQPEKNAFIDPDTMGAWRKVPKQVHGGRKGPYNAKSDTPATWCTFDEAVAAYQRRGEPGGPDWLDGIGVMLGDGLHGVDLDDCRSWDTESLGYVLTPRALDVLAKLDGYAEVSPSGTGIKIITRTDLPRSHKKDGVEIYTGGRWFATVGQKVNGHDALPAQLQSLGWLVDQEFGHGAAAARPARVAPAATGLLADQIRLLQNHKAPDPEWTLERVRDEILPRLSPDVHNDQWVRVGQALHHQGGGEPEWLDLWDTWSAGAPGRYTAGECEKRWETMGRRELSGADASAVVTIRSLVKETQEARMQLAAAAAESATTRAEGVIKAAAAAGTGDEVDQLVAAVRDDAELRQLSASVTATQADCWKRVLTALAAALKRVNGSTGPAPLALVKKLVSLPPGAGGSGSAVVSAASGGLLPAGELVEAGEAWVFDTSCDRYVHEASGTDMTAQGFENEFKRHMPLSNNGVRGSATDWTRSFGVIHNVAGRLYHPMQPQRFVMDDKKYSNKFRPSSVPVSRKPETAEDWAAIRVVQEHFEFVVPDARERGLLLSWIAQNVRQPGRKVRWAPFIWSEEGIGKELMVMLMRAVLGAENVNGVTQGELQSDFSDWKKDCCVAVLDEIKQEQGGARAARALRDQLKDVIANDRVRVHPKGGKGFQILNVTNYMAFSNHKDALAFETAEGDRRWFVLFCPRSVAEIAARSASGQMAAVARATAQFGDVLRWWLTAAEMWPVEGAVQIVEEFEADGRAPLTDAKFEAVEESRPDYALWVEDALMNPGTGIGGGVLSTWHLGERIAESAKATGSRPPSGKAVNRVLKSLGWAPYSRAGGTAKFIGKVVRVMVKGAEAERDIPAELAATAGPKAVLE